MLAGVVLDDDPKPVRAAACEIVDAQGNKTGEVTSGTMGPFVKQSIGMGYVPSELSREGSEIHIKIRDKVLKARVVKMPFYKG